MRQRLRAAACALVALLCAAVASPPLVASGQAAPPIPPTPLEVGWITQTDQNGDGRPDLTTIETNFNGGADRVLVFDGGADMTASDDWAVATDFENDTWVFDVGGDGRAELIVQFARIDTTSVEARLYDDDDGDGMVAYHIGPGTSSIVITESRFPRLTVTSWPTWTRADGGLTYNLRIAQDGLFPDEETSPELSRALRRDGRPDNETIFADEDMDGTPEYVLGRLLAPTPETSGLHRTGVQMNAARQRPRDNAAAIFWPLLGRGASDRAGNYFDTAPTIEVEWATARIRDAGLIGYPIEQGFHVNALSYLLPGVRNIPDFENMMAYYDLDGDRDRFPELFVRHRYYEAGDRHGENIVPASNEIRYSWADRNHNGLFWDYKLGLAGRHLITDTVRIGGFDMALVPYEQLPSWVAERTWDLATFVAREGQGYASSEGIYEWAPIEEKLAGIVQLQPETPGQELSRAAIPYLRGSVSVPPRGKFTGMRPGYRGEYAFEFGIRPLLYLSPVDRRMHLQRAEAGIWQVTPTSGVRYADSNKDGWIDAWTYLEVDEAGQVTEQRELHVLNGFLVYAERGQVVIRRADVQPSVYDTVIPTTGQEARAIKNAVAGLGTQPGPGELRQMLEQFPGEEQRIGNAQLSEFRPLADGGFRFVLDLKPGLAVEGRTLVSFLGRQPGQYVVTMSADGVSSVDPLTEPRYVLDLWGENEQGRWLAPDQLGLIRVSLTNLGLRDATNLNVHLERISADGKTTPLGDLKTDILAGEPLRTAITWTPAPAGAWTLRLWAADPAGQIVLDERRSVVVERQGQWRTGLVNLALPSTSMLLPMTVPLALLAGGFGLVVAIVLLSTEGRRRQS